MPDIANSVLARLKNKSKETGRSYQLCLQLFCQEEFLRRLENSNYANNLILKGGLFIYTLTGFESRSTIDIDFLIRQLPNEPEELKKIVEEIIKMPSKNDFVSFEVVDAKPIALTKKYAGVSISLIASIKNTRTPLSIDFGVGDVIVPKAEKRAIPTQLEDEEQPIINTYSVETTISEKLDAILNLMDFTSRMKDYYDVFYLSNRFDFEGNILKEAMQKTFINRNHKYSFEQYQEMLKFANDDDMNRKWIAFIKKMKLDMIDFEEVINRINIFVGEVFKAALNDKDYFMKWSANKGIWSE